MTNNRRTFFKGAATLGAGVLLPPPVIAAETINDEVVASDAKTVVDTASGKLRGLWRSGIFVFKGVPYGASTGGANRFMPPVPVRPWTGIRNALCYGRACIQPNSDSAHFSYDGHNRPGGDFAFLCHAGEGQLTPGEDCLQLNVWTPGLKDNRKRPVMVFYHGGGFSGGFDQDLASYDGENLARSDVVVVTCNHRLNLFGYLNLTEVGGTKYTANVGLLDLAAVLQWVKDNIAQFGGDPGNVTIFGQSGGGGKVACLMAMPLAKGLFHRAIIQSGPFLKFESRETARAMVEEVMRQLGLARDNVDKLQDMPVDRLVGAAAEMISKLTTPSPVFHRSYGLSGWWPTVDGTVLPRHPFDPDAPTVSAHVPLITGTVFNEQTNALDREDGGRMTEAELQQNIREAFGSNGPAIIAAYRRDWSDATAFEIYAAIAAEPFRRCAFEQAARKAALNAAPSFVYVYKWHTPMLDGRPGTFHACDVAFTFDNAVRCSQYSGLRPEALAISKRIAAAYVAFARSGNPNHPGLPHWPGYTRNGATMVFDNVCRVRLGLEAEGLALIGRA
jgi:para-nitrobenzyl esterase